MQHLRITKQKRCIFCAQDIRVITILKLSYNEKKTFNTRFIHICATFEESVLQSNSLEIHQK